MILFVYLYGFLKAKLVSSRIRNIFTVNTTNTLTDFFHYKDVIEMDPE